jgi:hypothetical protein
MHSTNYINWNWDRYSKNVKIYKPSPLKTNYFGNQYYDNIKQYIKPKPIPPIYVWRSLGDGKVRSSHQENDGKIFTRDNPPPTGHPGQGYNCRCIAEPYIKGVTEYANQTVISDIGESREKWKDIDFVSHFYGKQVIIDAVRKGEVKLNSISRFLFDKGRAINLTEAGHLKGVINYYSYDLGVMKKVNQQIMDKALSLNRPGYFEYDFKQSYKFGSFKDLIKFQKQYLYCFGNSTVGGKFRGHIKYLKDIAYVTGKIDYEFSDTFTDPISIREALGKLKKYVKEENEEQIAQKILNMLKKRFPNSSISDLNKEEIAEKILKLFGETLSDLPDSSDPKEVSDKWRNITDILGTNYDIIGNWTTRFEAEIPVRKIYR